MTQFVLKVFAESCRRFEQSLGKGIATVFLSSNTQSCLQPVDADRQTDGQTDREKETPIFVVSSYFQGKLKAN